MKTNSDRLNPTIKEGLSNKQVKKRIEEGNYNIAIKNSTKTIKEIVISNIFTFFNLLNLVLAVLIILVRSYKNVLFMGIIITNTLIGIIQEIRAKKTIDKLSLVSASSIKVIRESKEVEIGINDIVLDDVILFYPGNEIPVDCIVLEGEVEVNESLLTGEPDGIIKKEGDTLLSGSFIMASNCHAKANKVGIDSYAAQITADVKKRKKVNSELMNSLNKIIKYVTIVIVPIGLVLFIKEIYFLKSGVEPAIVSTAAALIGMIPQGLFLITSMALAVSVIRLGKSNILVQELYCIETLARVDVLCLDKTGTITEGIMQVKEVVPFDSKNSIENIRDIASNIINSLDDNNSTFKAMKNYFTENSSWVPINKIPFSSARKWSGVTFKDYGSYVIGAPEFVLNNNYEVIRDKVEDYSSKGDRVLLLAKVNQELGNDKLNGDIENIALIIIEDKIRQNVNETFGFFHQQGVSIKVISGDSPVTVSEIAKKVGVIDAHKYVDVSTLETEEDIEKAVFNYTIFGRVKPNQKRQIIKVLQTKGHTVAMTGDGVNDVLALKDSDCSIAMASGSDAARRISQLVLTDSNFKAMPKVVMEGRRVINNIERNASLFLVKTIYSFLLSILFLFIPYNYPFEPIQLTLISSLTIGIPSFFFTLETNNNIIKKGFLKNVIKRASIGALTIVFNIVAVLIISYKIKLGETEISSMVAILTGVVGLMVLLSICVPFTLKRKILVISMSIMFLLAITFFGQLFSIYPVSLVGMFIIILLILIDYPIIKLLYKMINKVLKRH